MNRLLVATILLSHLNIWGQSYAPPAGETGTTAIHMDSSVFTSWATGISVQRGFIYIEDTTFTANGSNRASFGLPFNALGVASGNSADIVSLGDSGVAILTFNAPIINGPGYDFAIFENSFSDDYLEFAFVEVSSDGQNFVRFPNHSEVQSQVQTHGFGLTDTRRIHNLAGKYRAGYGTPFDLEDLKDSLNIDLNAITHVKIIDVIGSIGPNATYDSYGNKINEPFSSPYESGGFDLDGVGVIHQLASVSHEIQADPIIYPNPSTGLVHITLSNNEPYQLTIFSVEGKTVFDKELYSNSIEFYLNQPSGIYFVVIKQKDSFFPTKLIIENM